MVGGSCCHPRHPRHTLLTDINVWTTMAAILAAAYPTKALHFFCKFANHLKTQQDLRGIGLGILPYGLPPPGSQMWIPRLGDRGCGIVQRGIHVSSKADTSLQILPCGHAGRLEGTWFLRLLAVKRDMLPLERYGRLEMQFFVLSICPPVRQVQTPPPSGGV